jgi:hypothetical protein
MPGKKKQLQDTPSLLLTLQLYTIEPLYKHTIGNRICMLLKEVCLCRGTVLAQLKN